MMRHRWGRFFTDDAEILELTSIALPIAGLCELGNCPQTTGCGVLRGSARPTIGANINLGSFYLVGMPVAMFLGFVAKMGFAGLWLGLLAAQASCALSMLYVLCTTDWMVQVERAGLLAQTSGTSTTPILPISSSKPDHEVMIAEEAGRNRASLEDIMCIDDDDLVKSAASLETEPLISTAQTVH
ncbi:MULTIDRUG RESISTANCE PROTEIN [Salix koriyanagi]|uniref:MULTIDRUG RESISTANCE PROTEIN n=1 Tax=Salix koriyanagi TaxID=2511006 RepID=A0A9Q0YSL7_9ROSI|nr:MULTIDRUG RESISTANCE PROTEIN [Salix koriyanagi]